MDDDFDLGYVISMIPRVMRRLETVEQAAQFFEGMNMRPSDVVVAFTKDISQMRKYDSLMNPNVEFSVVLAYLAGEGFEYDSDQRRFKEAV